MPKEDPNISLDEINQALADECLDELSNDDDAALAPNLDDQPDSSPKPAKTRKRKVKPKDLKSATKAGQKAKDEFLVIKEKLHSSDEDDQKWARERALKLLDGFIVTVMRQSFPTYMGAHFYDLQQEGRVGVLKGLDDYDPNQSYPTTWFYSYIVHEMQDYINTNVIKATSHYSAVLRKIDKAINTLDDGTGREISDLDIALQTGLTVETIQKALSIRNMRDEMHYDAAPGFFDSMNTPSSNPEDELIEQETNKVLYAEIAKLPEIEQKMLMMSYGLDSDGTHMPNKDIAKALGVSIDYVKNTLNKILRKLRKSNLRYVASDYVKSDEQVITKDKVPFLPDMNDDVDWTKVTPVDF